MAHSDQRVIVVGAGPVGAVMTLALVRKGIPVLLLEAEPEPVEDQRAATIHAPTLEMLADLGLKQQAFADDASGGFQAPIFQFRDRASGELVAAFDIRLLEGEVPYPFVLQWEQYKLVRAALPLIAESGLAEVRFATKLTGLTQHADHVDVTVETGGEIETSARRLRHRHRRRPQHGAPARRDRLSRASPGKSASSRSPPASISSAPATAIARAIISPIPTNGSICSRSRATVRPASGAASCRCRPMRSDEQALEHGSDPAPAARHPRQERRFRHSLLRALHRASARRRDLQQGPRAARRRLPPMSTIRSAAWA